MKNNRSTGHRIIAALLLVLLCKAGEASESGKYVKLTFQEMYAGKSSRGIILSEKMKSLVNGTVSIAGFMAPPLQPTINFFVLTEVPMSICPFCNSDADWPDDIVVVKLKKPVIALPFDRPIEVKGVLELGTEVDAETGFVSLVRIRADEISVVKR